MNRSKKILSATMGIKDTTPTIRAATSKACRVRSKHAIPSINLIPLVSAGLRRVGAAQIATYLGQTLAHLRCVMRGGASFRIAAGDLPAALHRLCAEMTQLSEIPCRFRPNGEFPAVSNCSATHLYYIAQEAVCNATRHGHASRIYVRLSAQGTGGTLVISDNGRGIPAEFCGTGLGLGIMRRRAEMVGGVLTVSRSRGGGTTITCQFPDDSRHVCDG